MGLSTNVSNFEKDRGRCSVALVHDDPVAQEWDTQNPISAMVSNWNPINLLWKSDIAMSRNAFLFQVCFGSRVLSVAKDFSSGYLFGEILHKFWQATRLQAPKEKHKGAVLKKSCCGRDDPGSSTDCRQCFCAVVMSLKKKILTQYSRGWCRFGHEGQCCINHCISKVSSMFNRPISSSSRTSVLVVEIRAASGLKSAKLEGVEPRALIPWSGSDEVGQEFTPSQDRQLQDP